MAENEERCGSALNVEDAKLWPRWFSVSNIFWGNMHFLNFSQKTSVLRRDFFYTLFSALEFRKIFRGGWEKIKIKFYFLTIAHLAKWAS
jgi:hypothetical protein